MRAAQYERVEHYPAVSIADLRRIGIVSREHEEDFAGAAPNGHERIEAVCRPGGTEVVLVSKFGPMATIKVVWTPCRFGGRRPWFVCPACGARRLKLHRVVNRWACRCCHELRYESQRLRPVDRGLLRASRIRAKFKAARDLPFEPLPPKPPRMRWRRYLDLEDEIWRAERAFATRCLLVGNGRQG